VDPVPEPLPLRKLYYFIIIIIIIGLVAIDSAYK
jgi:hypothetical protein